MAGSRYRFTITDKYSQSEPEKRALRKEEFMERILQCSFPIEVDPSVKNAEVSRFWVEAIPPPIICPHMNIKIVDFFRSLAAVQKAIGSLPFSATLDNALDCKTFSSTDKSIPTCGFGFGIFTTPFDFQFTRRVVAHPDNHRVIHVRKFKNTRSKPHKQIHLLNFYHDKKLFQLQMPASKWNDTYELVIELPYDAIKEFNVNIRQWHAEYYRVEIQVVYEHPPSLCTYKLFSKGDRGKGMQSLTWPFSDLSIPNFLSEMVNSPAISITSNFTHESLFNVLMMLQQRLQCTITFHRFWIDEYNAIDLRLNKDHFPQHWPFEVRYLIDCILSRGITGQKYLIRTRDQFVQICADIERLLQKATIQPAIDYVMNIYFDMVRNIEPTATTEVAGYRARYLNNDHYIMIRKAVITPTRILFYPPEPIMGSRMVREFGGGDNFLRVVVRSDAMNQLYNSIGAMALDNVLKPLRDGLTAGGKKYYYLASSSSQLREHGCYFYRTDDVKEVGKLYAKMGTFKDEGVAKMLARFGQCFTQSIPSKRKLPKGNFGEIPDYSNSARNQNGDLYCFSDGVGIMSLAKAKELQSELNLQWTPSCFQFRYAGYKGVLSVDPFLDQFAGFVKTNNVQTDETSTIWTKEVLFRPSQNKFTANEEHTSFEIVKYSSPGTVCLNRQLISIFDQVSQKQSYQSHKRVTDRILQLTDADIQDNMKSLTEEINFKHALRYLPSFVPINQLVGFTNLLSEPFFRRMVLAKVQLNLIQLGERARIQIPPNFGRNMFGVVDETGFLQYGQVFVQYSDSCDEKCLKQGKQSILEGDVMISKNPMLNMGDLRKFEAVNIPALRHLCDVVVFSQHGPRPSPDEMAGSDLDGDEYSVMWDLDLMLNHNEPATDYSAPKEKPLSVQSDFREQSIEFIKDYILNDGIGVVSNAHLANSDLYGLESNVCASISKKQIAAVDFQKSGIAMDPLVKVWKGNEPPEAAEQKPDFMQQNYASTYQSNRLLGHVYRKIQKFVNSVSKYVSQEDDQPVVDHAVLVDGWELYKPEAEAVYARYSEDVKRVMTTYGVKNEAELFSQCFTDAKNRQLQNRENDSFSSHTTGATIQKQLYEIWCQFRQEFYATADIDCAQALANGKKEFLQTRFTSVLDDPVMGLKLRRMAVAYYKVAYQKGDIISLPWVVWDVIDAVRYSKNIPIDPDPLGNQISSEIEHKKFSKYDDFVTNVSTKLPNVMPYIARYNGLGTLLYFLCKWKEEHTVLTEVSKTEIIVMFVKYATGQLYNVAGVLEHVDIGEVSASMHKVDLKSRTGGLGRMLLTFFIELSNDSFFEHVENWLVVQNFGGNNLGDEFCDIKKWRAVQLAARDTYFLTVFQSASSILYSDATKGCVSRPAIVEIGEYFTIDVLASFHDQLNDNLTRALCDLSGCTHISINVPELTNFIKTKPSYTLRVTLMPKGTPEAITRLRSLLTIDAPVSRNDNPADIMYLMKLNMTNQLKKLFSSTAIGARIRDLDW